jgi:hypothetical protein
MPTRAPSSIGGLEPLAAESFPKEIGMRRISETEYVVLNAAALKPSAREDTAIGRDRIHGSRGFPNTYSAGTAMARPRVRFKVMRLCCRFENRGRLGIWRRRN